MPDPSGRDEALKHDSATVNRKPSKFEQYRELHQRRREDVYKRQVGSEEDLVEFSGEVVRVNGIPLKNSARQPSIPSRMDGSVKLYEEVLVMSEHPLSFDSRYFGAVSTDAICTPLKPLITWE